MNLETGGLITRSCIWEMPITAMAIQAVEKLAHRQGIKSLKVTGKNKVPLLPADWVARVDHNKNIKDGNNEDYMPTDDELQDKDNKEMEAEDINQEELDELTRQDRDQEDNLTNMEHN